LTCASHFAGIVIRRENPEECGWIDALNAVLKGGAARCREALQGLNLVREQIKYLPMPARAVAEQLYRQADSALARLIEEGRCEDW